jgi:hypothetical protein
MAQYVAFFTSDARTADVTSRDISISEKYQAAHVIVDVTAGSGLNIIFTVQGKDPVSGKAYTLLASPIITGTGTTVLRIGPHLTAATSIAKDYIPSVVNVAVTQSGGVSATYSVGASFI